MKRTRFLLPLISAIVLVPPLHAQTTGGTPITLDISQYNRIPAPTYHRLLLKKGDRLAICGDSITEQKMYSRMMEDYLTMCVPQLQVTVRQFGWSGEKAPGFLARMTNDCLRFDPTIATTCYGMNDCLYQTYNANIGETYRKAQDAIVESFKSHDARVVQGSAGCMGKVPHWARPGVNLQELDFNLSKLRNISLEVARKEHVRFAGIFWPMLTAGIKAQKEYGESYGIADGDGVHPGWAGHTIMAYAYLKALGLDGNVGTFTVDLKRGRMKVSDGHELLSSKDGTFEIRSTRYPFCACVPSDSEPDSIHPPYPNCDNDPVSSDNTIVSGESLIPFNAELNRLMLVAKNTKAWSYKVIWGNQSKTFPAAELAHGINLAAEFPDNPFCAAFAKVDAAVAAKQAFETKQIKQDFRSAEARAGMEAVVARTEKERDQLAAAVKAAFVPVTYTLRIEPVKN